MHAVYVNSGWVCDGIPSHPCARVGGAKESLVLPCDPSQSTCVYCREPIWVTPAGERSGMMPVCTDCLASSKASSFDYQAYLRSAEWGVRREAAVDAAGGRCQVCNERRWLNVHHRTYERIGNELPGDLIVLCRKCHQTFHENARLAKA